MLHRLAGIAAVIWLLFSVLSAGPALAGFRGFDAHASGSSYPVEANGRKTEVPHVGAYALRGEVIELDGKLDDSAWGKAPGAGGFRVWDPDRGTLPSEETVFKVVYDREALYFGVACFEEDPANISSHLARRDRFSNSDLISIYLDPYLDKTTGYNFKVNPRGVQIDSYMFNDGDRDEDWDAIWQAETHTDEHGWYAEVRIPFSSIRYRPVPEMTWGLQVYRYMHGRGEDTSWVTWDRETRGFTSRFGELRGLRDVPAARQIEITPYAVQRSTDPAVLGSGDDLDSFQNLGADLKFGVTANLTLNATVQPDFGQVEADPAELNLSPFETFFQEKRPFFIEGSRFFQHPDFNLFYSRRIGSGDANSRIRLAGKLTGKTAGNISVAALVATTDITDEGQAHNLFEGGNEDRHFLVGRFGKEFDQGNHRVNLMQTAVLKSADRDLHGNFASREAYTTGLDFDLNFHNRDYNIQGSVVGSIIDAEPSREDPTITGGKSYGTGGALDIRKLGGKTRVGVYGRWEGDGLQLNDVGFLSAPDEIASGGWMSHDVNPDGKSKILNRANLNLNLWKSWLYAGRRGRDAATGEVVWAYERGHRQFLGTNVNGWMQFRNYWEAWWGVEWMPEGTQRYETRGGPLIDEPTTYGAWWGASTDVRKDLRLEVEGSYYRDVEKNYSLRLATGIRWNQSSAINHQIDLNYRKRIDDTQYLETVDLSERPGGRGIGGSSYVFGDIDQQELRLTLRTNLLFSRSQSLEIYAEPFISVADYRRARELVTPDSYDLAPYGEAGYEVADNDRTRASVNLNAVYRWEYRPGSTLFLVWKHSRFRDDFRSDHSPEASGAFNNSLNTGSLFSNEPENVFLAKVTYWFTL